MVRNLFTIGFAAVLSLAIAACTGQPPRDDSGSAVSSSASSAYSSSSIRETHNVAYEGVVRPAGISIYMEGTHRLSLENGKFVLLESESVDLNGYVDERVRIFGSLRPTVEAGGMIMRVERVELVEDEETKEPKEVHASEESSSSAGAASSSSFSSFTSFSSFSSFTSLPEKPQATDATKEVRIQYMSEQDYSASQWTQQYCTSHIGFCIPVHRNFWYKSFGATASALWHVEINTEPIERLGDGPIVVRLLPGSRAEQDKTIVTSATGVIGYRTWTENRHFEVSADVRLKPAIEYIIGNFTPVSVN